jgi:single-strand DNA-binding protein
LEDYNMLTISGVGRLGQSPKMQYTPSGTAVTNFSVAADCGYGDKKETVWVNLSGFGQQAEILNQYLEKGSRIAFTAEVQRIRTYTKKDSSTGTSLDAKVLSFSFLDKSEKATNEPEEF